MTFRSHIEPSIKNYECFMFFQNFRLEITLEWWILERFFSFKNRERVKMHSIIEKTKLENCLVILKLGCFSGWFWIWQSWTPFTFHLPISPQNKKQQTNVSVVKSEIFIKSKRINRTPTSQKASLKLPGLRKTLLQINQWSFHQNIINSLIDGGTCNFHSLRFRTRWWG